MSKSKITWTEIPHGGFIGHVTVNGHDVKIASISWTVKKNDPHPWILRTEIPGWKNARHHMTEKAAQESAERILVSFATAILGDQSQQIAELETELARWHRIDGQAAL